MHNSTLWRNLTETWLTSLHITLQPFYISYRIYYARWMLK
jgi:hypothetical protein